MILNVLKLINEKSQFKSPVAQGLEQVPYKRKTRVQLSAGEPNFTGDKTMWLIIDLSNGIACAEIIKDKDGYNIIFSEDEANRFVENLNDFKIVQIF